jgi:hypothetical protein
MSIEEAFRRITIGDVRTVAAIAGGDCERLGIHRLDARTEALVRICALVAVDASGASYRPAVDAALLAGASLDDLLAVLATVGRDVGAARVVAAAPRIALAAGYDVEAALE